MFYFSLKKRLSKTGLLMGMTDVHAHLLPGVDDGIRTFGEAEEAVRYCRERWFQEVAACIDSDPGRAFSPGELAKRCGMSRQSFYSKFKQATGMAPLEYIRRKRLREAELLLLDGDAGIGEIAERLRFADQFHFSHLFKKVYGMSPLRFRKAGRERNRQLYRS